jgi:hypothetical protein
MGTKQEIGLKITSAQREYYRYTGVSAEVQRRNIQYMPRPDFARLPRREQLEEEDRSDTKARRSRG